MTSAFIDLGLSATLSVGFDCDPVISAFGCGGGTMGGTITGSGNFAKVGNSSRGLNGTNLYTGSTTINDGVLRIQGAIALPSTTALILNGGVFVPYFLGNTVGSLTVNGNAAMAGPFGGFGLLTFPTGTLNAKLTLADVTLNGDLSGSGSIDLNYVETSGGQPASPGFPFIPASGTSNTNTTLNGQYTYTGATTVNLGALTAGVAGAFSPNSAFTVASGATLNLNSFNQTIGSLACAGGVTLGTARLTTGGDNSSTTFDGVISGTGGSLVKAGTGTMTLTGANTYTGGTTLNAGTLAMNGSNAFTAYTVNGGVLGGTGALTNVAVTSGAFAPGNGTAGSTQNVNGTLGFSAGGIYRVFVDPSASSSANVIGTATLTGGTVNAQFAAGSYLKRSYTILNAGMRTGTFSGLTTANLPAGFAAALGYGTANAVTLDLSLNTTPMSSLPGNQQGPANAITSFFNSGGALPPGFITLVGLTGSSQQQAYAQVSGQGGNGATQQTSFAATSQFIGTVIDPSIGSRGGTVGGGATGYAEDESEALAYADKSSGRDAFARMPLKAPPARDSFGARWSVWASGYGGAASVSGNAAAGTNSTTSSIYGTAVGADHRIGRDTVLGFSMGGGGTNFSTAQNLGKGRADLFQAGLYGRQNFGAAYVAGVVAYGWQDVTLDRTVTVAGTDQLRSRFQAQSFAARIEGGYRFATALLGVTPYGALQATRAHLPAYSEFAVSGSNQFALAFGSQNTNNLRSELGLRADKPFAVQDGTLTINSRVAWAHDSNTDRAVTPAFQSLPGSSFTVSGARPAADSAMLSAGAEMAWRNGWSVAGMFEGEFSRTTESYAGKGTIRRSW